ncbi:uncharacterized protein MYCFIDRAFT_79111 [Pseudocercospora fijiensis CIRAD86]|uniref:Uncharacterized protein n=1 Tax=Pseudocercospora fijiensis (strain CIRAD86) TaxID=383855 RepID=M2YJE5_PSEFD|nr:uncharacterized protein MYCFIDRAFT_79111 [Pseudocercospora fijiensis CIRAD86]EME77855.1 hypothetical protein MYCFIDRAFT_79111 [Pseudocercospora fijiensis CIRAD86]
MQHKVEPQAWPVVEKEAFVRRMLSRLARGEGTRFRLYGSVPLIEACRYNCVVQPAFRIARFIHKSSRANMRATLAILGLIGATSATPLRKRQSLKDFNDFDVLNYALTLEHLEDKFYREGLANFTEAQFAAAGYDRTFYSNLVEVSADETAHVKLLSDAITAAGGTPVKECTYAFGVTSPAGFVGLASVLEGVGASAYTGAASQIANKDYLTVAASILSIEARHSSYIRSSLAQVPFPQSLENPLTPNEVFTLASPFIVSCPSTNGALPIRAYPALALTTTGTISTGQTVSISSSPNVLAPANDKAHIYAAFITAGGPVFANMTAAGNGYEFGVTIPEGVYGQSYLIFNNCNDTVTDTTIIAGPALLEIASPSST